MVHLHRDVSELVMEQIELFRETRDSIQRARGPGNVFRDMSSAAWDRALQREMKAEGNLHPALCTPDGHYRVRDPIARRCSLARGADGSRALLTGTAAG